MYVCVKTLSRITKQKENGGKGKKGTCSLHFCYLTTITAKQVSQEKTILLWNLCLFYIKKTPSWHTERHKGMKDGAISVKMAFEKSQPCCSLGDTCVKKKEKKHARPMAFFMAYLPHAIKYHLCGPGKFLKAEKLSVILKIEGRGKMERKTLEQE